MRWTLLSLVLFLPAAALAQQLGKVATNERKLARFQTAVQSLASTSSSKDMAEAMKVLLEGFPESRPVLVEAIRKGTPRVRAFAAQVLGQKGSAEDDLEVVQEALEDSSQQVRRAALRAIGTLGQEGFPAVVNHLSSEKEPRIRMVAIEVLEKWRHEDAVPFLVDLLEKENDKSVRRTCIRALEMVSGLEMGDDVKAWRTYEEKLANEKEARNIVPLLQQKKK